MQNFDYILWMIWKSRQAIVCTIHTIRTIRIIHISPIWNRTVNSAKGTRRITFAFNLQSHKFNWMFIIAVEARRLDYYAILNWNQSNCSNLVAVAGNWEQSFMIGKLFAAQRKWHKQTDCSNESNSTESNSSTHKKGGKPLKSSMWNKKKRLKGREPKEKKNRFENEIQNSNGKKHSRKERIYKWLKKCKIITKNL